MKINRIISLVVIFAFANCLSANAYDFKSGGIYYNFNDDGNSVRVVSNRVNINETSKYKGKVIIPSNVIYKGIRYLVTQIESNAFAYSNKMTSIEIPNSVTEIGSSAFKACTALESIILPNKLERIAIFTFENCRQLTTVFISSNLKEIGMNAFEYCESLKNINLPSSLEVIESSAFFGCRALENISIPDGVTKICSPFGDCTRLKGSIYNSNTFVLYASYDSKDFMRNNDEYETFIIKDGIKTIAEGAFENSKLSSIKIPESVTEIGFRAFRNCHNLKELTFNKTFFIKMPSSYQGSYSIPDGTRVISEEAFYKCKDLTSVYIPNSVEEIRFDAFSECSSLTSITIPNNVQNIGIGAFSNCTNLKKIIIGDGLKEIGADAFGACFNLESIVINSPTPPEVTIGPLFYFAGFPSSNTPNDDYVPSRVTLYVPKGSKEAYSQSKGWGIFKNIVEM